MNCHMQEPRELLSIIREFVQLQTALVDRLRCQLGDRDWTFLSDVPRSGTIDLDGQPWRYSVHGTGVRFACDHASVDMNRHLDRDSHLFDAGRLVEYMESQGTKVVVVNDKMRPFDHETGASILRELSASGRLRRIQVNEGLYALP